VTAVELAPADRCLSVALELVAAGYALLPVVLELKSDGDKLCVFPHDGTGARLRSSTDPDQIRAWWVDDPRRSFAVDVHASGVEVVDLDVGPDGDAVGERSWGDLPRGAMQVRTRSGGWQFYFRRRPDGVALGNSAGRLPKVDTRGAVNDMAFAPGAWLANAPEQTYAVVGRIVAPAHLSPVPDAVVAAVGGARTSAAPSAPDDPFAAPTEHSGVFTPDQALTYCRHVIARLAACSPDGKYTALIAAARSLGKFEALGVKEWLWERCREALATSAVPVKDWAHARRGFDDSWGNAVKAGDRARILDANSNPFEPSGAPSGLVGGPDGPDDLDVDLTAYLDDDYEPERPTVGMERDDGVRLLYAGKWSTLMGETGLGKSWIALWHCVEEIRRGNHVRYAHFEEANPRATVLRLRALGVTPAEIRERFHWLDLDKLSAGALQEPAAWGVPSLVVLDGIAAACGRYGWNINDAEAVTKYLKALVWPFTEQGAAVLSLGHPVKARDRQEERHGYGATGWLDLVDGAAFRVNASPHPIQRGTEGWVGLYVVKDRPGGVEEHGTAANVSNALWTYLGSFHVIPPQSEFGNAWCRLSTPGEVVRAEPLSAQEEQERAFRWLRAQEIRTTAALETIRRSLRAAKEAGQYAGPTGNEPIDTGWKTAYGQWDIANPP